MLRKAMRSTGGRAAAAAVTATVGASILGATVSAHTGAEAGGVRTTRPAATPLTSSKRPTPGKHAAPGKHPLPGNHADIHTHIDTQGKAEPQKHSAPSIPSRTSVPDPAPPAPLVSTDIAHASEQGQGAVNITIDDGPDPVWTPKILKVLRDNHVKAVFCMIGPQATAHPDLVRQVVAEGHRLCDHSVHHDTAMDKKPPTFQRAEIVDAERMIETASGGVKPMYYRAPGGAFTPYSRQIAASMGMRPLGWNVDTRDFERPGAAAMLNTVRRELPDGPTILFHDGGGNRSQTVETLTKLLPLLRQQGHGFGFPVR
jgi:peptidoglycan/xylan/chitin deacetylase (PgdA/CDA1 family)